MSKAYEDVKNELVARLKGRDFMSQDQIANEFGYRKQPLSVLIGVMNDCGLLIVSRANAGKDGRSVPVYKLVG